MEILRTQDLTFRYPGSSKKTVNNVSISLNRGEFVTLCGNTGCGKSTFLRLIKKELAPNGDVNGSIFIEGENIDSFSAEKSANTVGFVMQRPQEQIVTDKVWHELAFGLENLNLKRDEIQRRLAEITSFFGIESWYDRRTDELSGGQKQLLNLAAIVAMKPKIIILDEPTSQLDPIAANNFLSVLSRLNRELAITVIIAEHRLEELIPMSDKLLVMNNDGTVCCDKTDSVINRIGDKGAVLELMPAAVKLYYKTGKLGKCPKNISEGREYIRTNFSNNIKRLDANIYKHSDNVAVLLKNLYFKYNKNGENILSGTNLKVYENEVFCLLGGNGTGKTTALMNIAGVLKPYSGKIEIFGKSIKKYTGNTLYKNCLSMLPQDVRMLFTKNTVKEEMAGISHPLLDVTPLYDMHPYDLSGGEQQRVAINMVFASNPRLLLFDEPTKGLDPTSKKEFINIIKTLKTNGITVIIVTHDTEFAAAVADRCAFCFRGNIISSGTPNEFFSQNNFYTTAARRMTCGYYENAVLLSEAAELCIRNGVIKK